MRAIRTLLMTLAVVLACVGLARAEIVLLDFNDEVHPGSAQLAARAIQVAAQSNAEALIIRLRTPGGLVSSMRDIVERILTSPVPIIVYVAPSGAQAASAGFFILMSADVAAMAPGSNTGAAHPVALGLDEERYKSLFQKVENDAAAYIRSIAEKRGRNITLAEAAVRESRSYTETEALKEDLIDFIANDLTDLLHKLDGWKLKRVDGREVTLRTSGQSIVPIRPTLRERLLSILADPNIALILAAIGLLCLYFEFNNPGAIVPAVVGGIALILALYGFNLLPINLTGIILMILAVGLFIAEAKVQGFGILGAGGVVSLVIGALILVDAPDPAIRIRPAIAIAVAVPLAVALYVILRLALRSRLQKVVTGELGMIGKIGVAQTEINPVGRVFIHGELWSARAESPIASGARVRVTGLSGLTLHVEAVEPWVPPQRFAVTDEADASHQQ